MSQNMGHRVLQVYPADGYKVYVYFSDGRVKLYNAEELVSQGVFKNISDPEYFRSTCTVLNNTLAWDLSGKFDPYSCLDIDPDELYRLSVEVDDPLSDKNSA